jgi:Na+/melibiose symporter-like transporter
LSGAISDSISTRIGKRHPVIIFGNIFTAMVGMIAALFLFPFKTGDLTSYFLFSICILFLEAGFAIALGGYTGLGADVCKERLGIFAGMMSFGRSIGTFASLILYGFLLQFVPYPLDFIFSYGISSVYIIFSMWYVFVSVREEPYPKSKKFEIKEFFTSLWIPFWKPKYKNFCFVFLSRFVCFNFNFIDS